MSAPQKKTLSERITINNILAITVVGSYVGAWLFLIWYGVTTSASTAEGDSLVILQLVESLKDLIITMTIITTIVIMYHFRTSPPKTS
jgi:hypothetical protein